MRKLHYLLEPVGRDKLNAILKANNLLIKSLRNYHKTTNSHHRFHRHKNLIAGKTPERPEEIWVSDITYLGNRESPLYLALVTDAYSKKVVVEQLVDKGRQEAQNKIELLISSGDCHGGDGDPFP